MNKFSKEVSAENTENSVSQDVLFLLSPTTHFLQSKYSDHRTFTIIITAFLSLLWASLWVWDLVTDPQGAEQTLPLRLLYLGACSFSVAMYFIPHRSRLLTIIFISGMLAAEFNFILILNFLEMGEVLGLAGFMYCMFIAVLTLQCFSLKANILYTLLACMLPHLASLSGILDNFHHDHYAALIWPAAVLCILAQTVQSHHYLLRYRLEEQLEVLSVSDPLTGVKNRRFFMPKLDEELSRSHRMDSQLSILMLDIDLFKQVNDTYGHPTGDQVIRNLATLCQQEVREVDIVARFGGEEFAVLLIGCDLAHAVEVAERIRLKVEGQRMHGESDESFGYTVSIGAAQSDSRDTGSLALIARVDALLYRAKEQGRNCVISC